MAGSSVTFSKANAEVVASQVWRAALKHIHTQAKDAGINSDFPDYVDSLFEKAVKSGYSNENVMALVKVLR